jgi:iron-sulfur cluster assembly accessory protein
MTHNLEHSDINLDKWFEELEASIDLEREQPPMQERDFSLFNKVLEDFHGNAPIIDESYNGQLPTITPKARIFITQNLEEGQYFRLGVIGGGCSGFNYEFDVATEAEDEDIQFSDSPPALVDRESLQFLYGTTIDLEDKGMNKILKVDNPGAKASCGCGTSFAFDEELLDFV